MQDSADQVRTMLNSSRPAGQCRTVLDMQDYAGQCWTVQGSARHWRTILDSVGMCNTVQDKQDHAGQSRTVQDNVKKYRTVQDKAGKCRTEQNNKSLVARCHSFHLFCINRADIQYFIYSTRRAPLLLSSLLSAR